MPEQFEVTAAAPTQELDAAGQLVDVMQVTGLTVPHQISFTVSTPKTDGWRDRILLLAAEEARELESLFSG